MGRPREHDEATREALRAAAERLVAAGGPDALTVRAVAAEADTTTRAVYSLFGSREGLVHALAEAAFGYLDDGLRSLPETDDPAADLVEAGATMYRRFAREHPSLFRVAFQRITGLALTTQLASTRARVWAVLEAKVRRLADAGQLVDRSVNEAAVTFNAMCEGLANAELRGGTMRPPEEQERAWRDAFEALIAGFAAPRPARRRGAGGGRRPAGPTRRA